MGLSYSLYRFIVLRVRGFTNLILTLTVVPNSSIQIVFPPVIYKEDLKFNQIFSIDEDFGNPFINNVQIINL